MLLNHDRSTIRIYKGAVMKDYIVGLVELTSWCAAYARIYVEYFPRWLRHRMMYRVALEQEQECRNLATDVAIVFKNVPGFESRVQVSLGLAPEAGYLVDANGKSAICWETPICITITIDGKETFGLGVELSHKTLCIRQMQGVKGVLPPTNMYMWPCVMVQACLHFAITEKLDEVRIYRAEESWFFRHPDVVERPDGDTTSTVAEREHAVRLRMLRRYNGTARKMGFKRTKRYFTLHSPFFSDR